MVTQFFVNQSPKLKSLKWWLLTLHSIYFLSVDSSGQIVNEIQKT